MKTLFGALKSKTIWFNVVAVSALLVTMALDMPLVKENPDYVAIALGVQAAVNMALRAITKVPLSEK